MRSARFAEWLCGRIAPALRGGAMSGLACALVALVAGCGDGADSGALGDGVTVAPPAGGTGAGVLAGNAAPPPGASGMSAAPPMNTAGTSGAGGAAGTNGPAGTAGMAAAGSGAAGAAGAAAGAAGGGMPPTPAGPEDGDPNQPVIAIDEVACGGPAGGFGGMLANHQIGGRDMVVTYPCDKHGGAPATFILNLHGTTPLELHFYQHGYFAAHQFAESHNLIIVTPSSVVQQWGNGDNGEDEPHLLAIIDWVYATLHGEGKFDIRAMWVGGHSWGGGYTARFGCNAAIADKVKGLILMSGGGVGGFGGPACANDVSVIISTAEGDGRMPSDQASLATMHGCDAAQNEMILMNDHMFWPNCDPGFVHANYYMLGKEHATSMDREVVESIVDWIKLSRQ